MTMTKTMTLSLLDNHLAKHKIKKVHKTPGYISVDGR